MDKLKLYNPQAKLLLQVDTAREIARGGEGIILPHPTEATCVLKIYHDNITPSLTAEAWQYLNKLDNRFIKPRELYCDKFGSLIGFSMNLLDSSFFRLSQLFTRTQCVKLGIDGEIKNKIISELIALVEVAHSKQVVIGDFNPFNIFVNTAGEVRLLDTDSFETPVRQHSGRLLDDIRDHYYLGKVSRESDFYALAVNVFRLLTFVHPYKGVHKTWKKLEERACKRISVLCSDPDLIIPAFYEPLANVEMLSQFKRIFDAGERFLLKQIEVQPSVAKQTVRPVSTTVLSVKVIAEQVIDFYFNENLGYIKRAGGTELYECKFTGNLQQAGTINNADYQYLWVGNKNILEVKNNQLYQSGKQIKNFVLPDNFRFVPMDHIVFGADWENTYLLNPDRIVNDNVAWSKNPAWGRGFRFEESPVQHAGGVTWIHYRNADIVNAVKAPSNTRFVKMKGNVGVITTLESEKLNHYWIWVDGLNLKMCRETDEIFSFAVKETAGASFVFVPADGKIDILKTPEFEVVDSICMKECTSQSQIFLTRSGLLLLEGQVLYLINRK